MTGTMTQINLDRYYRSLAQTPVCKLTGKVIEITGGVLTARMPGCAIGSQCRIHALDGAKVYPAEVVGFRNGETLLMALSENKGIGPGSLIELVSTESTARVGDALLGRVIDGLGQPLDGKGALLLPEDRGLYGEVSNPLDREIIAKPLSVGVRAIDGLLTIGQGQRMGIMAGSGVGKSVLLGMMAKNTDADINVIALIGERGREVKEFIEEILGEEGLKRSVVVAVTSDQSALLRMRGAFLATTIAEFFAGRNKNVLLMMDSVTRFAMAQREIGLSTGEPPTSKGYTPSVFSLLPKLLERAGNFENSGSVTGLYTVLVEGDDMDEPIADAVRSIVDGHIVLSRKIAQRSHFPAIDVLQSTSRVMKNIVKPEHATVAAELREILAVHREAEDLINIGAYKSGSNPKIDRAVQLIEVASNFLKQSDKNRTAFDATVQTLRKITGKG